jgi:dipeptidyl aminopeptidase/acylaminoacyl peptidase
MTNLGDLKMHSEDISFFSDGYKVAGQLCTPSDYNKNSPSRPGILVLPGYSGNMKVDCSHLMRKLCQEGWFVLGIFYRGFGESEGTRGRHRPLEQSQNAYDALSYMQTIQGIDPNRLGIYGTSFGGANSIWVTAHDERVKCLVTSVAVTNGERWMKSIRRPWEWWNFKDRVMTDAKRRVLEGTPGMVPKGEIMIRDPDTASIREQHEKEGHVFHDFNLDLESAESLFRYKPEWVIDKISPRPVLMIYGERDSLVPPEEQLLCYEKCGEPKKLVKLPKGKHYDSYEFGNLELSSIVYEETINWFQQYL